MNEQKNMPMKDVFQCATDESAVKVNREWCKCIMQMYAALYDFIPKIHANTEATAKINLHMAFIF